MRGPVRIEGVEPLTVDQLVTLTASELRKTPLAGLLKLMHQLGLSTDGVDERTAAITRLMQNAYEVE